MLGNAIKSALSVRLLHCLSAKSGKLPYRELIALYRRAGTAAGHYVALAVLASCHYGAHEVVETLCFNPFTKRTSEQVNKWQMGPKRVKNTHMKTI